MHGNKSRLLAAAIVFVILCLVGIFIAFGIMAHWGLLEWAGIIAIISVIFLYCMWD